MRLLLHEHFFVISLIIISRCFQISSALLLLSDLPTPAFLINVDFLQQQQQQQRRHHERRDNSIAPIILPSSRQTLVPVKLEGVTCPLDLLDQQVVTANDNNDHDIVNCAGTCYWHASVVRSRGDLDNSDDTASTFLAELDMPANNVEESSAQLVLGLNNHHVGSYYWARSAGAGAAMEAPGIQLLVGKNKDCLSLHWASTQGPTACNSNDGKRSEWVNFLRPRDQVQLIPLQAEHSLLQWIKMHNPLLAAGTEATTTVQEANASSFSLGRIFGVSNYKRPLGSEPAVVCEWKVQQQ